MRLFYDADLTSLRQDTQILSFAIIGEDDRKFFIEFQTDNPTNNIHVMGNTEMYGYNVDRAQFPELFQKFIEPYDKVDMWSDYLMYSWVAFCELFGGMDNLPLKVNEVPYDLCTYLHLKNISPHQNREDLLGLKSSEKKTNALWEAMITKSCLQLLDDFIPTPMN